MSYRIIVWKDSDYVVGDHKEAFFSRPRYNWSVTKEVGGVFSYQETSRIIDELPFPKELLT